MYIEKAVEDMLDVMEYVEALSVEFAKVDTVGSLALRTSNSCPFSHFFTTSLWNFRALLSLDFL